MPNKYSKTKLEKFKKAIEKKMGSASDEIETIKEGIGSASNKQGGVTPDSIFSVHMADAGTDSNEREKAYHLYNRQTDYHRNLLQALQRIEDGTFGVCVISGELIPEERMLEVPNATKRVEHKEAEKLNIPKK